MKKIFLLILTALTFASCTLYMDEPEDDKKGKDDNIENGDGFSAPRTDVTADGTTTYQFNSTTKVFDETNSQYVLNAEDSVVWLSTSTPYEMIPQVGDAIYSTFSEKFPNAMMGKVVSVTKENGMIKCVCTDTTLGHVYKKLDIHASINVADYMDPSIADKSLAEKRRYAMQRTRDEGIGEPEKTEFSLDLNANKDLKSYKFLTGSLTGYFNFKYLSLKYRKIDFDLSLEKEHVRFIFTDSTVTTKRFKVGGTASLQADIMSTAESSLLPITKKLEIPIGSSPVVVGFDPSLSVSVSGTAEAIGVNRETSVQKMGIEKTANSSKPKIINSKYSKSQMESGNDINGNLTINADLTLELYVAVKGLDKFFRLYGSGTTGPQLKLSADTDINDMGVLINNPPTIEAGWNLSFDIGARFQLLKEKPIWNFKGTIFEGYWPVKTFYLSPRITTMDIIPLDYISDMNVTKRRYCARVRFTETPKTFNPFVIIYNSDAEMVMTDYLNKKSKNSWEKEFEIDNKNNKTFYAMVGYEDDSKRAVYSDKTPFGVRTIMELSNCRQACSYTDFDNPKRPVGYEIRGELYASGKSTVTQWGMRFELHRPDRTFAASSKPVFFELRDGKKKWGLRLNSRKPEKYIIRIVPIYKTGYGKKDKFTAMEDKAMEVTLDPEFGECKEPTSEDPNIYFDLLQTK